MTCSFMRLELDYIPRTVHFKRKESVQSGRARLNEKEGEVWLNPVRVVVLNRPRGSGQPVTRRWNCTSETS